MPRSQGDKDKDKEAQSKHKSRLHWNTRVLLGLAQFTVGNKVYGCQVKEVVAVFKRLCEF